MKPTRRIFEPSMLLDIASYARLGPRRRDRLSSAELEQIERTVRRAPEVMIKVLSGGGQSLGAVQRHIDYIGRKGEIEIETDEGERLMGRGVQKELLEDWDLDLDSHRRSADLDALGGRMQPKFVHKLIFSMPAGTPPDKVVAAVRAFAQEEFALKHRYAMVLHTDEPHPHVHVVVKAVSEQGVRLHIKKATLRAWRREFAQYLRKQGIEANATERAVRGESRIHKLDGIYRAERRGASTYTRARTGTVVAEMLKGNLRLESGKSTLLQTRNEVERGWRAISDILIGEHQPELAAEVSRFVDRMSPPRTEKESLAAELRARARELRDQHPSR